MRKITVHYNGHATVVTKAEFNRGVNESHEAGKWVCSNNQYITIEEVIETIDTNANTSIWHVYIKSDCCGAGGAYDRLVKKLFQTSILISPSSRNILNLWTSFYRLI